MSPALSLIHVEDLVSVIIAAAERGQCIPANDHQARGAGRYFAVAPEYPTYAEVGLILRPMLGRKRAPVLSVPGPLAYCVGGLNELVSRLRGRPAELCVDKIRDALVPSWACSGDAARRDLGFLPLKSLSERFQETVNGYLTHPETLPFCKTHVNTQASARAGCSWQLYNPSYNDVQARTLQR